MKFTREEQEILEKILQSWFDHQSKQDVEKLYAFAFKHFKETYVNVDDIEEIEY